MTKSKTKSEMKQCGIVMPISALDGCNEQHWVDVKDIISSAVEHAEFIPNLVSYADDVGIIQKRIIQNLYENPMVVCDVSGKNPNVMFELGLRLAFDKPTIIIKDDNTSYSFDTSPIEHLEYPRDLRFNKIIEFKKLLSEKIISTYNKSTTDENYSTFLKHFGSFRPAHVESIEISKEDYIIEELKELRLIIEKQDAIRRNLLSRINNPCLNGNVIKNTPIKNKINRSISPNDDYHIIDSEHNFFINKELFDLFNSPISDDQVVEQIVNNFEFKNIPEKKIRELVKTYRENYKNIKE